jgi:hypothetical protein
MSRSGKESIQPESQPMAQDVRKKIRILNFLYITATSLLLACVVATPLLVRRRILPLDKLVLDEDLLESILIAVLLVIAGSIYAVYRRELRSVNRQLGRVSSANKVLKDRLTDAFRYIGTVNVQLQEIHAVFSKSIRYPENRGEFKRMLAEIAFKTLGIVDKDWMLIRIVDRCTLKTHIEHWEMRFRTIPAKICVSNRAIVDQHPQLDVDVTASHRDNATVTAACVFPLPPLNREERILMQSVASEMEMIYTVFTSQAGRIENAIRPPAS